MEIIGLLEDAISNPWMVLYLATWVIGIMLKSYTKLDAKKIPWILVPFGAVLALFVIELSISGAVVGAAMALLQMGLYDTLKPLIKK